MSNGPHVGPTGAGGLDIAPLLEAMTLTEKIAQMTQVEKGSITPDAVASLGIGSILSGGGGNPEPNDPEHWRAMVTAFTDAARESRLGIPLLYGVDAVHGHANVRGATVFPHNIGLGACADADLVERVARATAAEMAATGAFWDFAPTVAVARDIRWGRTYESFGRDPDLVATLGAAAVRGLQSNGEIPRVLACLKHYVGDGGTAWGSVNRPTSVSWWDGWGDNWQIDQGDLPVDEETLRAVHLPPYAAGIAAGAMTVMASYSSWRGERLHGHRRLLTDVLKGELGFSGMVVSDWMGVDQLASTYEESVVAAIDAGIDMVMVPFDYRRFLDTVERAVTAGAISVTRIDDAVTRILRAKAAAGLFAPDQPPLPPLSTVGASSHRALAAQAARRGAVLLRDTGVLPLRPRPRVLHLAGVAADDIGLQCGGWTIEWLGAVGPITPGTTLRQAFAARDFELSYDAEGRWDTDEDIDVAIVCIAEPPYAEGMGDRDVPRPRAEDIEVFDRVRERARRVVVFVYSGRPLVMPEVMERADAVIAAWLPGSEATLLPDLVLGDAEFEGRLPQPWPASVEDLDAIAQEEMTLA